MITRVTGRAPETSGAPGRASPAARIDPGRVLSELEHLLRDLGCPVCDYVAEAERFSWFEIESFSAVEMHERLRAGIGMCPRHLRRLIEQVGAGHIMATVIREALAGARISLRADGQRGSCPACDALVSAAAHASEVLLDGLADPGTARLYCEHRGMCLPHVLNAIRTADRAALAPVTEKLLASLGDSDDAAAVELLAGRDQDATRRASWRERLPQPPASESTLDGLRSRLMIDACPSCLAAGLIDRRYLRWFVERRTQDDASLATDPGEFCAAHLHDLALIDSTAAALPIKRKRAARTAELRRFLDRLALSPPLPRRGRRAVVDDLGHWRAELMSEHYCPACNARTGGEHGQLELLVASLGLAPLRDCYEGSHGLCVRHARAVTDEPAARVVKRHLDARLGILAWEVRENARKLGWAYRHEERGPERDAWAGALAQVDGRVFEGGSAPAGGSGPS